MKAREFFDKYCDGTLLIKINYCDSTDKSLYEGKVSKCPYWIAELKLWCGDSPGSYAGWYIDDDKYLHIYCED